MRVLLSLLKYYAYVMDTTSVIILCSFTLSCYEWTRYRQCILAVTYFLFCFVATLCVNKDVYIIHFTGRTPWRRGTARWTQLSYLMLLRTEDSCVMRAAMSRKVYISADCLTAMTLDARCGTKIRDWIASDYTKMNEDKTQIICPCMYVTTT